MGTELTTRNPQALSGHEPDVLTLGKVFAASGYFKDARDQAQAVVKILAGRELGIPAVASMTGIYIVKERVTLSANLLGAVIKRSGRYDYRVREMSDTACRLLFRERAGAGWEDIGNSDFTIQDAQKAGLHSADNWRKFPRNMLFARALSNGAKWFCPDVFGGPIYTPDELGAHVDGETGEVLTPARGEWPKDDAPAPVSVAALPSLIPAPQRQNDDTGDAEIAAIAAHSDAAFGTPVDDAPPIDLYEATEAQFRAEQPRQDGPPLTDKQLATIRRMNRGALPAGAEDWTRQRASAWISDAIASKNEPAADTLPADAPF